MAAEPKRPPPPKSYVPLTLLDGPPALPPRPRAQNGASSIQPHTPTSPTGDPIAVSHPLASSTEGPPPAKKCNQQERRSESPVPVKPARRKTKRGPAPPLPSSQPATMDGSTTQNELKESVDSPGPDSTDPQPPVQQARRHTFSKSREKPPTPPPYAGQSPLLSRALSERKKEEKESNHLPASPVPATPPPYAGQSPILSHHTGTLPSLEKEKKGVPASPVASHSHPTKGGGQREEEGKNGSKEDKGKDREREKPPAPGRPARDSADGQQLAPAKPPALKVNRPPPNRPSRPPAANTPPPESLHLKDPPPRPRPRTVSASSPASSPKSGRSPNIHKRDTKPEITVVSVQPMLGDSIPPPSLSRRMTAPSRPLGNPRKHPGPPPPRKSTPPSQNSPPTSQKIESPDTTTSPAARESADQQTVSPPGSEHEEVARKSPPAPRKPPREAAKPEAEEAQKGKRPPPPRPGSRPPPPSQDKKAPPPATRPVHPPSIKRSQNVEQQQQQKQQQKQQQQQQDELERKLQELGPPPTEEPPELPPEALEADLPLPSKSEQGPLPHPTTQELLTPQAQPPSSPKSALSGVTVPTSSPTPGTTDTPTPRSPPAPRKPPKRPTQPPPPKHTTNSEMSKGLAEGEEAEKDKQVEADKHVKPTAPARKSLSTELQTDVSENPEKVAETKQEALATKPTKPSQRPPPPKIAKHREEATEPPSKAAQHQEKEVKSQQETNQTLEEKPAPPAALQERPPVKRKPSVPRISPSPEVISLESEKQEKLPQVDKPPVVHKQSVTPPPSPHIVASEGEKREETRQVEKPDKPQTSDKSPPLPETEHEVLASKPTRPFQRPPPPKVVKRQDEGMRPAQRPPPPKVSQHREEGTESPAGKHQEEPQVETNQDKPAQPAALLERPPAKEKASVPRISPSSEVTSPEGEKQEKLTKVHKPPVARKPSSPRATPPPSPDVVTSEGEKKEETTQVEKLDKPQLTTKLSNNSLPPPETEQEALASKPTRPFQRPPPPKVVKRQDEGMRPTQRPPPPKVVKRQDEGMRPAQRPPPPKVAKHREEVTEPPAGKHQEEPQVETNQDKPAQPAALLERPPAKEKASVPRISPSSEVTSPEGEKQEKLTKVHKPPVARKPSNPRATPPPSPDVVTSEGEKKEETMKAEEPDKPQLATNPSNKSPAPLEAKQEAPTAKPMRPTQRPPPPKVVKRQDEGMRPAQRPPPPKVAKHREEGTESPAGKHQEEPQVETNQPPEEKPSPPAASQETPPVKQKPSVPRIAPSPENKRLTKVHKPPVARKPSSPRATPSPSPDVVTSEGEKKEETMQVEKPDKPQLTRKPSNKSPPPPGVAAPEVAEGDKQTHAKKPPQVRKPSVTRRPVPISKKSPSPPEAVISADNKPEHVEEPNPPPEKLSASAASTDHEDEKQAEEAQPDLPEKQDTVIDIPEKTFSGLPPREPRKVERKEREELKGGGEVEMVRVIRTSEGVTEQFISGGGGIVEQAEGGSGEREEQADIDPTTTTVKLREKPSRPAPGDKNLEKTKRKPPRPLSMPPGNLPGPKPAQPSQKPGRPPSLIVEKPGRPAPPSRPSQKPPAKKATPAPRKDSTGPPKLPPRPSPGHLLYKYVCSEPHGLALTVHDATTEDELSYQEGDVIELIERLNEHWFFARNADNNMMEGVLPAKDLKIIKRLPGQDTVAGFEEGPCAVATHNFRGEGIDELSFKEGDLIMLKTRVDDQWLRGKLVNGAEGIFPKNFVEIVEDLPESAVETPSRRTAARATEEIRGPHCVVLHPFTAEGEGELSIASGDTIELLERVGTDWLKGRKGQAVGIFPSQFVEIKVDLPPSSKVTVPGPGSKSKDDNVATAVYDFGGQDGELSFKTGDKIKVTARVNQEWVRGELGHRSGIFPVSFVDAVPPNLPSDEAPKAESPASPSPRADTKSTAAKATGKCEALFDFTSDNCGELSFSKGEVIIIKELVNDDWLSGQVGDREGLFPVSFVKIIEDLPKAGKASTPTSKVTNITDDLMPKAVAAYDYSAGSDQEISFKEGDVLYLLNRVSNKWYLGENTRTDQIGEFPSNFVNVVVPLP